MKKWALLLFSLVLLTVCFAGCGKEPYVTVEYITDNDVFKTVSYEEIDSLEKLTEIPRKDGYFFGGWYYDFGKWEKPFDVGEFNYNWEKGSYKVYAKWEVVELTLAEDKRSYTVSAVLAGAGEHVSIPSYYEGLPVATIGDAVFRDKTNLLSVDIPDTVKHIGSYAFSGCTSLTSLTMPHSVLTTGTGAFEGCNALASIRLSEHLEILGARTFAGCTALTEVSLPSSLIKIGGSAFFGCTGFSSMTLPKYLQEIGPRAFGGCTGLTTVAIPDRVTTIEEYAFEGCTSLSSVTFGEKTSLMQLCKRAFAGTAIESLTLPKRLAVLYGGAFAGMEKLKTLTFAGADIIDNDLMEGTPVTVLTLTDTMERFHAMTKSEYWYRNSLGNVTSVVCTNGTVAVSAAE